jgi:hypothetical protein
MWIRDMRCYTRRPLSLIESLSLWHDFGNNYMIVWAPISSEVQPIISRRTGKQNESIKSSRICSVLVLWAMVQNGTSISHLLSSHITTVIKKSIKMSPFEALYGRPYRIALSWSKSGEQVIFGPDIVTEAEEKVRQIRANIMTTQSLQKSYTGKRRRPLEFEVGNHVYLWVSSMKGVRRFVIKEKLAPRYISPYPIIDKYGPTSNQVELLSKLSWVHNVFHVPQLKGCLKPPTDVVVEDTIPLEPDLAYKTHPIKILDQ